MEVGDRLKKIRQMYGLSQRELAKRVNLTNSTISMIEQNRVSPSVSSLKKILSGIPMTVTEFFTIDVEHKEKVAYSSDELIDLGSEGIQFLLVGSPDKDKKLAFFIDIYAPGSDTEMITMEGEEAGTVLEGSIELTVGGEVYNLKSGDCYNFCTKIPHRFRNRSKKTCRIASAISPPNY